MGVYSTGTVEHTDLRTRSDDAGAQIGLRRRGCAALSRTRVNSVVAQGGWTLFNVLWLKLPTLHLESQSAHCVHTGSIGMAGWHSLSAAWDLHLGPQRFFLE